jgi:hypothetical protein
MSIESLKEIEEYIRANAETNEVQAFVGQFRSQLDRDNVVNYLESEQGRALKQSIVDKAAQAAIDTYRERHLPKDVETELLKRNPPKSEAEKRLAEVERELESMRAERMREAMKNSTIKSLSEKDEILGRYAPILADVVIGGTEEETTTRVNTITEVILKAAQEIANKNLAATAHKPTPGASQAGTGATDTEAQLATAIEAWKASKSPRDLALVNALERKLKQEKKE